MYGGAGKLGRGGGKRNTNSSFLAPPKTRLSAAPGGRLSVGGGVRGRGAATSTGLGPSTASVQSEETYSLVTGNPLNFAMIIRLVPDMVEEIKRVEAEGANVRIKFDANANNSNGNAINVGDKNFKFTWSRETGDLCDIYEERQSGEDGNGLLVESGGAWRRLNVQRVLDESTKNHVKMRSQEAEQKLKSRKAIVLDHQNPTMKNQIRALAAAESTPWRTFKQKKEPPFKKRKTEPPPGGPAKSVYKSAVATTTPLMGRTMDSPLSSPREQFGAPASPFGSGNLMKGHAGIQDSIPTQASNRTANSEKEMPGRVLSNTVQDKPNHMGHMVPKAADLKSMVISLLMEHHSKGMSLKGLEKAIGDAMPNSVREIEPILKQVAIFQAPGRYFLKQGVDMKSFKKPSPESGSSPELDRPSLVYAKSARLPPPEPSFSLRNDTIELEENARLNSMPGHELDTIEEIDILHSSPTALSDKKVSDNSEGPAASSSSSDSDSSDSGSDSGSHSRSRSPVASRSGSSSDSESDSSSNSKQASDEDVDIMTSDDDDNISKSKHRSQDSEPVSPKSPIPRRPPCIESADIVDDHVSDVIEIEKDLPEDDHETELAAATNSVSSKDGEKPVEGTKLSSPNYHGANENQVHGQRFYSEVENVVRDGFKQQQSDSTERMPKGNFKSHSDERPCNSKRSKGSNSSQTVSGTMNALFGESPCNSSPGRPLQGPNKDPNIQMANRTAWDGTNESSIQKGFEHIQKGFEQAIPSRSVSESHQPDRRSFDASGQAEVPSGENQSGKHAENLGRGIKYSKRNLQTSKGFKLQKDKSKREAQGEDGFVGEKRQTNFSPGIGDEHSLLTESRHRKNEIVGKIKEPGFMGHSPKDGNANFTDRSQLMNDRGRILRREQSDLELGEFREPIPDETPGSKKQFERENSFKKSENKSTSSEHWNSDSIKGKPSNKITSDSRKLSSPNPNFLPSGFPDGSLKSKTPEHYADDLTRSHQRTVQSHPQKHQSRHIEGGTNLGTSSEAHQDMNNRVPVNEPAEQHYSNPVPPSMKEGIKQKSNAIAKSNDKRKDASFTGNNDGGQKRRESSSDESSCLYSKYEKDKPEMKGPINDSSQYKEYVQEFQEKYESYCSLNKILESYRIEFNNLGKDLEVYRGRDTKIYNDTLGQLRASFRQCGKRHKRLKKIFIVLHEELKQLKQMIKEFAAKD